MTITIDGRKIDSLKSSVGFYIFNYAKNTQIQRSMDWLCDMCQFYKTLDTRKSDIENPVDIEVSKNIVGIFPDLIQNNIFNEIDETGDCDVEWLCLMTDVYQQMLALQHKEKYLQADKPETDDVEADGQEMKNRVKSNSSDSTAMEIQAESDFSQFENESLFDENDYVGLDQDEEELY